MSFYGTHLNRFDAKGRVSIPASFRALLKNENGQASLVVRPSHTHPCIEGWPNALFNALASRVDQLDQFSADQEDIAAALFADAYPIEADREGRIVIPATLLVHANVTDSVVFMGLGRTFQIWEPAAADRRRAEVRDRARTSRMTLPAAAAGANAA